MTGLYGLTADGQLGVYDSEKRLVLNAALSQSLAPPLQELLKAYLADLHGGSCRLGLIHHSPQARPWNTDTLALEESCVRQLYPVSGPVGQELTTFQKKNREKSVYRGLELLLEYRQEQTEDVPAFCPLLFDRRTWLHQYPPRLGYAGDGETETPVIEVLNLMAVVSLGQRKNPELLALVNNMHQYLVKKSMRHNDKFTLDHDEHASLGNKAANVEYFGVDQRHNRHATLSLEELRQRAMLTTQVLKKDHFEQVERWLERPHRSVDAAFLRNFVQFRHVENDLLNLLTEYAQIYTAPSGTRLLDIGMIDPWNMYLMEGTVSLQAADDGTLHVTGGSDKAANPISFLKPRKYIVQSTTPISFLWIHDALLDAVLNPQHTIPSTPIASMSLKKGLAF